MGTGLGLKLAAPQVVQASCETVHRVWVRGKRVVQASVATLRLAQVGAWPFASYIVGEKSVCAFIIGEFKYVFNVTAVHAIACTGE